MQNRLFYCFLFLSLFLVSCDSKGVFDDYETVPEVWNKDKTISFNVSPPDSTKAYNLFVNLRNTDAYKYSNLFLIVEMNFPHGKSVVDTLEYKMTKPNGEFLGTGLSSVKENKFWYKEGVIFSETGDYTVNIKHAMRENGEVNGVANLEGITDIGFRIEKTE
ncbi:gliding motility lipoprotein GldH [Lacinutrix mariniflava]|uniref:gliding motility lipoprotein GldH n=1 Tax=Lacinutrix mariniflava TaxID=342955 RepID=UPI0006E1DD37|nr:gliding motility lipoprotein GldH [Lacinutrix mariniflava]